MHDPQIEAFLAHRQDEYEALMVEHYENSETLDQFFDHHTIVEDRLSSQLSTKWARETKTFPPPPNLKSLFQGKIEEIYENLKRYFIQKLAKEVAIPSQEEPVQKKEEEQAEEIVEEPAVEESEEEQEDWVDEGSISTSGHSTDIPVVSTRYPRQLSEEIPSVVSEEVQYALGIDLGTTMCCVAVVVNGNVEIVQNRLSKNAKTTPSYIAFHEDGQDSYGQAAKDEAYLYPETTIYDAKRMIGRSSMDDNLLNDKTMWPFTVVEENGNPKIMTWDKSRYPHEISARLLARFPKMAAEHLGARHGTIKKAVITVPAYFSEPQRRATRDAARCAGLEVLNILSEPTAAAIAYNYGRRESSSRTALIYDLGGGTFDVAIARVERDNVDVLCVHGDTHLGGQDVDQLLMEYCIKEFHQKEGIDLMEGKDSSDLKKRRSTMRALARLRTQCELAKERLSCTPKSTINVASIAPDTDLFMEITEDLLDELCKPLIQKTLDIVGQALEDAASKGVTSKSDIDDIILIGGSTRLLLVERMVQEYFDGKELCKNINPDEAVAYGAAIEADILLKRNAASTGKQVRKIEDVTPHTLGIECLDDTFSKVIPRNTKIPCNFEEIYSTSEDNQTILRFSVFQGESDRASENCFLGTFFVEGIPPGPVGQEEIKVTMTINYMGILQVRAVTLSANVETSYIVTANQIGMSEDEIKRVKEDLETRLRA